MWDLSGKRVLITGGARGIGRAMALQLARHNASLYLLDMDQPAVTETAAQCRVASNDVVTRQCDISQRPELSDVITGMLTDWGTPDILINNAGVCFHGPTGQMKPYQWDQILKVNLLAPVFLTRQLLPHLLSRPRSHILNVSSIFGLLATNRCAVYHLTKYGLVGFSEALRAEYSHQGMGVTALCPGFVQTDLFGSVPNRTLNRSVRKPPRWLCTSPEKVAIAAVRGIRRNRRLVLVSPPAHLMYYTKRIAPGLFDTLYRVFDRRYFAGVSGPGKPDSLTRLAHPGEQPVK